MKKNKLLKAAVCTAATLGAIYGINRLVNKMAVDGNHLNADPEDFYHWSNGKVYLKKKGEGKPLLLVHDLNPMASAKEWERVFGELSKTHTVYEIDLPGCGRSDKKELPYVAFFYVQLIQSVLENVIREKTDIAVTGASAPLILSAAAYDSSMIDKLILVNPYEVNDCKDILGCKDKAIKGLYEIPLFGALFYNIKTSRMRVNALLSNEVLYNPFNASTELIDTCYESAHLGEGAGRYLMGALEAGYLGVNTEAALSNITNEILVVFGESNLDKEDMAEKLLSVRDDIKLVSIDKSLLLPQIEEPEKFADIALKFLAGEEVEEYEAEEEEEANEETAEEKAEEVSDMEDAPMEDVSEDETEE